MKTIHSEDGKIGNPKSGHPSNWIDIALDISLLNDKVRGEGQSLKSLWLYRLTWKVSSFLRCKIDGPGNYRAQGSSQLLRLETS
ncbi:hypothetical protein Tco_0186000 [Tanacetum coccineum]